MIMQGKIKLFLIPFFLLALFAIPFVVFGQTATSNCVVTKVGNASGEPQLPPECVSGGIPDADRAALLTKIKQYINEGKIQFGAPNDSEGMTNGTGQILRMDGSVVEISTQILRSHVYLVEKGFTFYVSCLVCSHNQYSSSGNVSRHWDGFGSDVAIINGINVINPDAKEATLGFLRALNELEGSDLAPDQVLINGNGRVDPDLDALSMNDGRLWPGFTTQYVNTTDHQDHVHIGY